MRIPLPRADIGWTIALSPRGGLVAYDVNHTGNPSFHRESEANYEVAVSDTTGRDVISFARGIRFAWRPDGKALAIAIGTARWPSELVLDSIVIWEPGKGTTLTCRVPLSRGLIGWAGTDTLLIGSTVLGSTVAVSHRTGIVSRSHHHGVVVSSDGLYSLCATGGWVGFGVFADQTGANMADSIVSLLGLPKLERVWPACWVRYKGRNHILAISACSPWSGAEGEPRHRECLTGLVDVRTLQLVGWTKGRLVGPTADSREAVIVRGGVLSFVGDGDWDKVRP